MYQIILTCQAEKFLDRIPEKHAQQIIEKIDLLAENPERVQFKQLQGFPHLKRFKSGEYRIIFQMIEEVITIKVVRIGKRNDGEFYKNLDQL